GVVTNTSTLCWVMVAAAKILNVMFQLPKGTAVATASVLTLLYTTASGFWGVLLTDQFQFVVAMLGMILLGVISWSAVHGMAGLVAAQASGALGHDVLNFLLPPGPRSWIDHHFCPPPLT